jgi:HEAT repeat protein
MLDIIEDEKVYWLIKKVTVDAIYNIFQNNWYINKRDTQNLKRILNKNMAILSDFLRTNESENYKVKLSLIKLLENFGGQPALEALIKRVNDFHRVVRIHASNAIKKIEERLELENSY